MLPPGHIAAGYLTAKALLHFAHPNITPWQTQQLTLWGMFWGFAPDLDAFWFAIKNRTLRIVSKDALGKSHRNFFTHVPLFWLVTGLAVYFFNTDVYWKYFGLLIWLASWSHMLLDTIVFGIPWLSPFSGKFYGLRRVDKAQPLPEPNIINYAISFLKLYILEPTFYLEIIIIFCAIGVYLTNH